MGCCIVIDLGASSGRIILAHDDGKLDEFCRFEVKNCRDSNRLCWDHIALLEAVRSGLHDLAGSLTEKPLGVSCDSWAQDFVLLDKEGKVFTAPVCYRDGALEKAPECLAKLGIGEVSRISTVSQLALLRVMYPEKLDRAAALLHIADWINYELGHGLFGNYSMFSAGKLLDDREKIDVERLAKLGLPESFLPPPVSCRITGQLDDSWPEILRGVPVISGVSHDSAAAFTALPAAGDEAAVILGSWMMLGCSCEARRAPQVIGIVPGKAVMIASGVGMLPQTQCIAAWKKAGIFPGFAAFDRETAASGFGGSFRAVWTEKSLEPSDVAEFFRQQKQPVPEKTGDFGKALCRGLAEELAEKVEQLSRDSGRKIRKLVIGGGGSKSEPLMDMIRQVTQCECRKSFAEATGMGNLLAQQRSR